jgi:hypothetical protein
MHTTRGVYSHFSSVPPGASHAARRPWLGNDYGVHPVGIRATVLNEKATLGLMLESSIMSDALAAIIAALIGLVGVAVGYYFSRRASENDRKTELQYTIYKKLEETRTLVSAFQKRMISQQELHEKWNRTTEDVLIALVRSGLSKAQQKQVLHAINGKWEDPQTIKQLEQVADSLLEKLDPKFTQASKELLEELGQKREDIDPVILPAKPSKN